MPNYTKADVTYIIRPSAFEKMYRLAPSRRDRNWVLMLYLTGARPSELLKLTKEDVIIGEDFIRFKLVTKKLGYKKGTFFVEKRNLKLNIKNEHRYRLTLRAYLNMFRPEQHIFNFSDRTGSNIVERLSMRTLGVHLCPYNFRHSRLTILAEKGASREQLKAFKGARSDSSINQYIHAREVNYTSEFGMKDIGEEE